MSTNGSTDTLYAVECVVIPQDSLYYASREAGETFMTKPYLMHTALYYAFGFFPTRFRVVEQRPSYLKHRDQSEFGDAAYVHPAERLGGVDYQTRRFAAKGDAFRSESTPGSGNFKETGHQKMIAPATTFRTFVTTTNPDIRSELLETIPTYVRIGKKMTTARVDKHDHEATIESGEFSLGQPISDLDYPEGSYRLRGNVHWERMAPVDLLTNADLEGRYAQFDPAFGARREDPITLPVDTAFLARK